MIIFNYSNKENFNIKQLKIIITMIKGREARKRIGSSEIFRMFRKEPKRAPDRL